MPRVAAVALLALSTAVGCHSAIPPYSVNVPPRLDDVRPPRSVVFVHDELPLAGLNDAIGRAVPPEVSGTRRANVANVADVDVAYHLTRRPIALGGGPGGPEIEVALAGNVSAQSLFVHCQANDVTVSFHAGARPALRPSGDVGFERLDWRPSVHGNLRCDGLAVPLDSVIDAVVRTLADALAKAARSVDLPTAPFVRQALDELRAPRTFPLDANDPKSIVCLDLAPDAIVLAPLAAQGGAVALKLGAEVAPRVVLGPCPASGAPTGDPSPAIAKNVALPDHFAVAIDVAVPYADLAPLVAPAVVGHRFGDEDHGVTVDAIELADSNGRALAHLTAHGTVDGDVYLWGTPTVVQENGRFFVTVPDVQVAVESRSVLERMGLSAWQAAGGDLTSAVRDHLKLDVTDRIAQARAALTGRRELPKQGAITPVLSTTIDRIEPGAVTSKPGVLVLQPVLVGGADLALR
jgi:hypothetical protein